MSAPLRAGKVRAYVKLQKQRATNAVSEARLVGTVPELSNEGKHNFKTAADCQDGQRRLKNSSEVGWDGTETKQEGIKLQRGARTSWDGYKTAARLRQDAVRLKQEREA